MAWHAIRQVCTSNLLIGYDSSLWGRWAPIARADGTARPIRYYYYQSGIQARQDTICKNRRILKSQIQQPKLCHLATATYLYRNFPYSWTTEWYYLAGATCVTTTTVDIVAIIAVSTEGEATVASTGSEMDNELIFLEKPIVVANRSHIGQKMRILRFSISQHQQQNNGLAIRPHWLIEPGLCVDEMKRWERS